MSLLYRLSALPAVTTLDATDIVPCVDISAGANGTSKITIANLRTVIIGTAIVIGAASLTNVGRLTKVASAGTLAEANILDNCSGVVTLTKAGASARAVTLPDSNFTVAGQDLANTFSANQTFTSGSTPGAPSSNVIIGGGSVAIATSLAVGAAPSSSTAALLPASTTSASSLRLPHGTAPTSPVNGDIWTTTVAVFVRINGVTVQLSSGSATIGGSIANDQVAIGNGSNAIDGSSSFTWDGTSLNLTGVTGLGIAATSSTNLNLAVSTTGVSSLRIGHGAAPTSPVNGDIWTTTTAMFVRINGATVQLGNGIFSGSIAANQIAVGSGTNALAGSANFTWDGTSFTVTGVSGHNIAASSSTALNLSVGTTGVSSLRIGHGVAPTSPVNGDIWTTTAGFFVRINGSTITLGSGTIGGSITTNQIAVGSGTNAIAGSSSLTWDGTSFAVSGVAGINTAASSTTSLNLPASTTGVSSLRLAHGVAPTSPVNGDIWTTTAGVFARIAGSTVTLVYGTLSTNQVIYGGGSGSALASTALFTDGAHLGIGATYAADAHLVITGASSGVSSLRIVQGSAPTSPVNGDIWTTSTGFFVRINGTTQQMATGTIGGSIAANQIAVGSGTNAIAGSSNFTWDGTSFTVTGVSGHNIAASSSTALNLSVGTTGVSSLRIGHGTAPTSPVDGDIWTTTIGFFVRINGATQQMGAGSGTVTISGSPAANQLAFFTASTIISSGSNLLYDGTTLELVSGSSRMTIGTAASSSTKLNLAAATTSYSSLRLAHGSAPTSPVNGDMWTTTSGLFVRINGSTVALGGAGVISGSATANFVAVGSGTNTISGSSSLQWDGTFLSVNGAVAIGITASGSTYLNLIAASTGNSSMRMAAGTAPTSPVSGDVWHDSARKAVAVYVDTLKQMLIGVIFTQTAISTDVTNTVTATTILAAGTGTKQLQADFFTAGKTIRLTIKGRISSAAAETGTIDIKLDGTTIVSTGSVTLSSFSNNEFEIMVDITCYTTGASGTVVAIGQMLVANPGGSSLQVGFSNSAAQTLDTTTSYAIDAKMTWGSASSSDHITTQVCSVEILN